MSKPSRPTHEEPHRIDDNEETAWASERPLPAKASSEPILAGTLCLLTLNVLRQASVPESAPVMNAFVCRKIASNLRQLSNAPGFSSDFRQICERLLRRWQDEFDHSDPAIDSAEPGLTPMPAWSTRH